MPRQPYIYTMPEGFMTDPSIGVKWKIYAIINGFWISGKKCYAANKFFAERLGVSERQIRNGVAQLEIDGYLDRVIYGNHRVLMPKAHVYEEAEAGVPPGGSESSAQAEVRVPHISDSNSDNISGLAEARQIVEVKEEEQSERVIKKKKVTPEMQAVFDLFKDNPARLQWRLFENQRVAAEILFNEFGIDTLTKRYQVALMYRGEEHCPFINNPSQFLEKMNAMERFLTNLTKA